MDAVLGVHIARVACPEVVAAAHIHPVEEVGSRLVRPSDTRAVHLAVARGDHDTGVPVPVVDVTWICSGIVEARIVSQRVVERGDTLPTSDGLGGLQSLGGAAPGLQRKVGLILQGQRSIETLQASGEACRDRPHRPEVGVNHQQAVLGADAGWIGRLRVKRVGEAVLGVAVHHHSSGHVGRHAIHAHLILVGVVDVVGV